jgi:hypothetical protein
VGLVLLYNKNNLLKGCVMPQNGLGLSDAYIENFLYQPDQYSDSQTTMPTGTRVGSRIEDEMRARAREQELIDNSDMIAALGIGAIRSAAGQLARGAMGGSQPLRTLYHASSEERLVPNFGARVSRQSRRGDNYGLYGYDNLDDINKFIAGNVKNTGKNVHQINLSPKARILDVGSNIERITDDMRRRALADKYNVLTGKSLIGKDEYVILNDEPIASIVNLSR